MLVKRAHKYELDLNNVQRTACLKHAGAAFGMKTMDRKIFKINLMYFKESGKLYASDHVEREFPCLTGDSSRIYMYDVIDWVRGQRDSGEPLPGLIGSWAGYILIDCEEGYPHLLLPKEKERAQL